VHTITLCALWWASPKPAEAVPSQFRDDPFSNVDFASVVVNPSGGLNGNTFFLNHVGALNESATVTIPDLMVMAAWFWPSNPPLSMAWSNALNGWFINDYLGTSLLVTLDTFPDRITFGSVSEGSGSAPIDPAGTFKGVSETRALVDRVPSLNLGAFAPGEEKFFDLAYTFHFGDGRSGNTGIGISLNTFSVNPSSVPEPSSFWLLLSAGLLVSPVRKLLVGARGSNSSQLAALPQEIGVTGVHVESTECEGVPARARPRRLSLCRLPRGHGRR
jgi:hypothetical protein